MRAKTDRTVEALEKAHQALREDLRKLRDVLDSEDGKRTAGLPARLEKMRTHVVEHFRLEEKNGYMETVRKGEPRLAPVIEQLAQEHQELAQTLDSLCARAKSARSTDAAFRADLQRWIGRLHRHEERENEVVQAVYNQDVGAED
jgi:hemerythrin-like domain-containing protein